MSNYMFVNDEGDIIIPETKPSIKNYGKYDILDGEVYDLKGNKLNKFDKTLINNITMWMQTVKYNDMQTKVIKIKKGTTEEELFISKSLDRGYVEKLLELNPIDETLAICEYYVI